ncbi:MAG: sialidase family protein [Planctomycetaceae bacterium]
MVRIPPDGLTRHEFSRLVAPLLLVSTDGGRHWSEPIDVVTADQRDGWTEEFDVAELENGDLLCVFRRSSDAHRWQSVLKKSGDRWLAQPATVSVLPHSGQPELLATQEGPVLHIATTGIHATTDAGATWSQLSIPGSAYYPRSVQVADGQVFVFGHIGGDDAYGKVDQSIVMDRFRLERR